MNNNTIARDEIEDKILDFNQNRDIAKKERLHKKTILRLESYDIDLKKVYKFWALNDTATRIFICAEDKTYILEAVNADKYKTQPLAQVPLYPTAYITKQDKSEFGKRFVRFKVRDIGDWKEINVPLASLSGANSKVLEPLLGDFGVTFRKGSGLSQHTITIVTSGLYFEEVREVEAAKNAGWNKIANRYVLLDDKDYLGTIRNITSVAGDEEEYMAFTKALLEKHPMFGYLFAFAVGGFWRGFIPDTSTTLTHVWGDTTKGKSMVLDVINSICGYEYTSWASTRAGMEPELEARTSSFMCIDEISQLVREEKNNAANIIARVFDMANGGGRLRKTRTGEDTLKYYWDTSLLSTGNASIIDFATGTEQDKATVARIIEIYIDANNPIWNIESAEEARGIASFYRHNYGHLYHKIIDIIQRPEVQEKAIAIYKSKANEFDKHFTPEELGVLERIGRATALTAAGAVILEEIFGTDTLKGTYDKVDQILADQINNGKANQVNELEELQMAIADLAVAKPDHTAYHGYKFLDGATNQGQVTEANRSREDVVKHGLYLAVEQDKPMEHPTDFTGKVWLKATKQSRDTIYRGIDVMSLVHKAKDLGFLEHADDRPNRKEKSYRYLGGWCYCWNMATLNELIAAERQKLDIIIAEQEDAAITKVLANADEDDLPF